MAIEIEWDSHKDAQQRRYPYSRKASIIHGWVTKMRGTILDNEAVRREGIREMKQAKIIRKYKRTRNAERKARGGRSGGLLSRFSNSRSSSLKKGKPLTRDVVLRRDHSSRRDRGEKSGAPLLHYPSRSKPPYHGHGTRLAGHLTQNQKMVSKGKTMNSAATKERQRNHRRRQKQNQREALAMKVDATRGRR